MVILPLSFYARKTTTVATELLGKYLILNDNEKIGLICETEAYPGIGDRASHSHRGPTPRTVPLFGPAGTVYVYLIYGLYHCLNIVTDTPESGGAVLIRAVKPIKGLTGKTSGPGLLCKSYGIDRTYNGSSITTGPLTIQGDPEAEIPAYTSSPRVGVDYAGADASLAYRYRIVE